MEEENIDLSVKVDTPGENWFELIILFTGCHSSSLVNRFVNRTIRHFFPRDVHLPRFWMPKKKKIQIIFRGLRLVLRVHLYYRITVLVTCKMIGNIFSRLQKKKTNLKMIGNNFFRFLTKKMNRLFRSVRSNLDAAS